jgi:hypothetical protein
VITILLDTSFHPFFTGLSASLCTFICSYIQCGIKSRGVEPGERRNELWGIIYFQVISHFYPPTFSTTPRSKHDYFGLFSLSFPSFNL